MSINLLSWRENETKRKNLNSLYLLLAHCLILMLLILGIKFYLRNLQLLEKKLNLNLTNKIAKIIVPQNNNTIKQNLVNNQSQIQLINKVAIDHSNWLGTLRTLQNSLPINLQLSQIIWSKNQLQLKGLTETPTLILPWIKQLEMNSLFMHIQMSQLNNEVGQSTTRFILTAQYIPVN